MAKPSRLRSLLRLLVLGLPLMGLYAGAQLGTIVLVKAMPPAMQAPVDIVCRLVGCVVLLVAYRLGTRWFERSNAPELATARLGPQLAVGIAIGVALFAATEGVLFALDHAHYAGLGSFGGAPVTLAGATLAAIGEELVFRGVVFRALEQAFGTTIALVLSAALFGGLHALNPDANLAGEVSIALEAGLLLGLAYALTRTLWLPIGLHLGWNFTEGGVFGSVVSGSGGHATGIINVTLDGPALWTGGAFGPEASLAAVIVCVTASVLLGIAAWRAGQWRDWRSTAA